MLWCAEQAMPGHAHLDMGEQITLADAMERVLQDSQVKMWPLHVPGGRGVVCVFVGELLMKMLHASVNQVIRSQHHFVHNLVINDGKW